jgi:hypothetical protein
MERRGRVRINWHAPVLLFRSDTPEAIQTITENLSSTGFYCLAQTPLTVGERLICSIKVPTHDPSGRDSEHNLECKIRVMRTEPRGDGVYGIAFRIEDYQFQQAAECS